MRSIKQYQVVKISHSKEQGVALKSKECNDLVVIEEPLEIWLSSYSSSSGDSYSKSSPKLLFTTMRTPGDDLNLVRGWLYSSGALQDVSKIESITHTGIGRLKSQFTNRVQVNLAAGANLEIAKYQRLEVVNSACGVCGQTSIETALENLPRANVIDTPIPLLTSGTIEFLIQELRDKQLIFERTGGTHGVALFDQRSQLVDVREDVGRHNAFDKLIGANLDRLVEDKGEVESILGVVLSSRASFELIQKAAMVNIRYVIALGAPSSLAIDLANDCDICLLGFVKNTGVSTEFNVYSSPHLLA